MTQEPRVVETRTSCIDCGVGSKRKKIKDACQDCGLGVVFIKRISSQ